MSSRLGFGFRRSCRVAPLLTALALMASCGLADDRSDKAKQERPKNAAPKTAAKVEKAAARAQAPASPITPEREAAALAFARENHAELASLLDGLKRNAPKEYQAALIDLDRAVDRIGKLKDKSPDRYEFELADWKITSRIRLLAARLTMSSDPIVEVELRAALRERLDLRLAFQRTERDRLQSRVAKLDQQIEEMASKADATIEKQVLELRKTLPTAKPATKSKPKKPATTPADAKQL